MGKFATCSYRSLDREVWILVKLGLALGSGAARGYAHLPVLEYIKEKKVPVCMVSGCSAGAIVGAYYALYGNVHGFIETIRRMKKSDWIRLIDPNAPKRSMVKGKKVKRFLQENFFFDKTFDDVKIPLIVCATNLNEHKAVYFTSGKIIDAVMASISIPGIFPPYMIDGAAHIDGGVIDPVPVDILLDNGCDRVLGVNLYQENSDVNADSSMVTVLMDMFYLKFHNRYCDGANGNLFMMSPKFKINIGGAFRFYDFDYFYDVGTAAVKEYGPELDSWLA